LLTWRCVYRTQTYTAYVNNFTTSNKALSELIKSNAKLQKFIQDTYERLNAEFVKEAGEEKMSDNQTQVDLRGLLIMVLNIPFIPRIPSEFVWSIY
jgi:uncharacterized membrane protein (DUF106 family)